VTSDNPFVPYPATLKRVTDLTLDVKLFCVEFNDHVLRESFDYMPGQFGFLSAYGVGEAPFGITSVASHKETVDFAVRQVGTVSYALHELQQEATVGVRGPFGNSWPMEDFKGKNLVVIGGGIGFAPVRPVITWVLENREAYGDMLIFNGARTPSDLVFASEFDTWASAPGTKLELTVDRGDDSWEGRVALLPDVLMELNPSPKNAVTVICGPPIMIKFTLEKLKKLGFEDEQIFTTLESKMKCGLGKCARCNVGDKYICQDGPVFNYAQISQLIEQF